MHQELVRPSLFMALLEAPLLERYQRFLTESLVDAAWIELAWPLKRMACHRETGFWIMYFHFLTCKHYPHHDTWIFPGVSRLEIHE